MSPEDETYEPDYGNVSIMLPGEGEVNIKDLSPDKLDELVDTLKDVGLNKFNTIIHQTQEYDLTSEKTEDRTKWTDEQLNEWFEDKVIDAFEDHADCLKAIREKKVKIGDYTYEGEIGKGGFGVVMKFSEDSKSSKKTSYAFKTLLPSLANNLGHMWKQLSRKGKERFSKDYNALIQELVNESDVKIEDMRWVNVINPIKSKSYNCKYERKIGQETIEYNHEMTFMIMDYINAGDLEKFVDKHKYLGVKIPDKVVGFIGWRALKGLNETYSKLNIVHRDISPQNILLQDFTKDMDGIIADFGSAVEEGSDLVDFKSKLMYAAPGQLSSKKREKADIRDDIYCMGATLEYLLLQRSTRVFSPASNAFSMREEAERMSNNEVKSPDQLIECSEKLGKIISKMKHPLREERYSSIDEVMGKLTNEFIFQAKEGYGISVTGLKLYHDLMENVYNLVKNTTDKFAKTYQISSEEKHNFRDFMTKYVLMKQENFEVDIFNENRKYEVNDFIDALKNNGDYVSIAGDLFRNGAGTFVNKMIGDSAKLEIFKDYLITNPFENYVNNKTPEINYLREGHTSKGKFKPLKFLKFKDEIQEKFDELEKRFEEEVMPSLNKKREAYIKSFKQFDEKEIRQNYEKWWEEKKRDEAINLLRINDLMVFEEQWKEEKKEYINEFENVVNTNKQKYQKVLYLLKQDPNNEKLLGNKEGLEKWFSLEDKKRNKYINSKYEKKKTEVIKSANENIKFLVIGIYNKDLENHIKNHLLAVEKICVNQAKANYMAKHLFQVYKVEQKD